MTTYQNRLSDIDILQKQIESLRPLSLEQVNQLKDYYRVGFTYTSNALEGNKLTESETKVVLEDGITIGGKTLNDHYEAVGHGEAFDHIYKLSTNNQILEADILELHKLFYYRIDSKDAGIYRSKPVIITGTDYVPPPPHLVGYAMDEFIKNIPKLEKLHPVIYAARLHADLVTIHPFIEGNGRTARLLMNLALFQKGYPITIIPPVVRADYIEAIKAANKGNYTNFDNFILCMVWKSQRDYLRLFNALNPPSFVNTSSGRKH